MARRTSTRNLASQGQPLSEQLPPRATRRQSSRVSGTIPATTDKASSSESDIDDGIATPPVKPRLLKEVSIPAMALGVKHTRSGRYSAASPMSISDEDTPMEYDTPATSITVTPEASLNGKISTKRKRSRLSEESRMDDISDDFALAQALQEEEYAQADQSGKRVKKSKASSKTFEVEDSDAEEGVEDLESDDLSSAMSLDGDDFSIPFKKPAVKSGRKSAPISVPETDDDEDYEVGLSKARAGKKAVPARATNSRKTGKTAGTLEPTILDSESEMSEFIEVDSGDDFAPEDASVDQDEEDSEDDAPLANRRVSAVAAADVISISSGTAGSSAATPRNPRSKGFRRRRGQQNLQDIDLEEIINGQLHGRKYRERKKLERAHPSIKTMWDDLKEIPIIKPVQAQQPAYINRKLKSFQLEGLDWMTRQEKTQYKGGLLGDEMGMGKTIQAVSLIMSDYPQKQPTLVCVPPVALMQWSNEINEYTDGRLNVLVYHGQNSKVKKMTVKDLKKYDVIMVSYNGLESLYRKETKGWSRGEDIIKEDSPLHAIHFHRLILDEAHSIKSRTTGVARACFALKGTYKWCLSGTPVQNRIGEFSLSSGSWKSDHSQIIFARDALVQCFTGRSTTSTCVMPAVMLSDDKKQREKAMDKLHMITARIMLRRMKRDHTSSMELPPKEVIVHNEFFGEIERDFSSSIMTNTTRQFDTYVSRGVMLNNYANIFGLIMQMRQVANHPDLLLKKHAQEGQNVLVCNICDEPAEEAIRSKCKHDFCRSCVKSYVQTYESSGGEADCPRCHIPLSIDFDQPDIEQDEDVVKKSSIINRIKMENWTSSTKIEMLIYDLYKLRSKKQTLKSIVFSQFTSMLQLIEWRLRRAGFNTVMLDGSMTPIQRQRSIEYFMNNPDVEVFLVSLKAGGVALNLTEASRVFIVDPWWNPAAEWQSADRCHRIGQKRPCVITRLCIEDSVESRMVMLQEKKANMISGTINNDKVAMEKLTPEDMQFLFRGS
ncbi:DNA repair protein rad16 [Taxawa tesnikishii (nom. ined.)]|nr:DNA repair protein rad16 [Dothideales sp. JES 119]